MILATVTHSNFFSQNNVLASELLDTESDIRRTSNTRKHKAKTKRNCSCMRYSTYCKMSGNAQVYKKRRASKQHKVCSLKGCLRRGKIGCMHCTCDGSCKFAHDGGQCGNFREGSQNHCRLELCPHDSTCTHSKRAVCYQ